MEIVDPDAIVEGGDVLFTGLSYINYIEIKTLHIMMICSISEEYNPSFYCMIKTPSYKMNKSLLYLEVINESTAFVAMK